MHIFSPWIKLASALHDIHELKLHTEHFELQLTLNKYKSDIAHSILELLEILSIMGK